MTAISLRQFLDALTSSPIAPTAASSKDSDFAAILSGTTPSPNAVAASTETSPRIAKAATATAPAPGCAAVVPEASSSASEKSGTAADPFTQETPESVRGTESGPSIVDRPVALPSSQDPARQTASASSPGTVSASALHTAASSVPVSGVAPTAKAPKQTGQHASTDDKTGAPCEMPDQAADPAQLTIQQALLAVASFLAPQNAANQASSSNGRNEIGSSPFASIPSAAPRAPSSVLTQDLHQLLDTKNGTLAQPQQQLAAPHELGIVLDQHVLRAVEPARSDHAQAALGRTTAVDQTAQNHIPDLHQLDALVRDIAEVSGSTGRAALKLTADQLGSLDIKLHRSDAGISVTIRAESEQTRSTVAQAQQQLADDMRTNGLKVAATSVMLGNGGTDRERQDRHALPFQPPIEAAAKTSRPTDTANDDRPDGRYA